MIRSTLSILPAVLLGTAPLALALDDVHVISASNDTRVNVTAGEGYTDERTVADGAGPRWQPCHHRHHRRHEDQDVQYGWDGVAYSEGCGGPAVRVQVAGPYLPPPRMYLPSPHLVAPLLAGAVHVGLVHGLATVGVVALKIATIPLILPVALHR